MTCNFLTVHTLETSTSIEFIPYSYIKIFEVLLFCRMYTLSYSIHCFLLTSLLLFGNQNFMLDKNNMCTPLHAMLSYYVLDQNYHHSCKGKDISVTAKQLRL